MRYYFAKILLSVLKSTYGKYLKIKYNIICEKIGVDSIEGSYIILSNHVNNLDPFFINQFIDRPISFVVSEAFFKKPILGKMLKFINMIPKKKFVSDMKAIRKILLFKKKGYIIGIFPEGRRTWNGKTDNILESTAKLIKKMDVPVVGVNIKGGMLSKPRWATYPRRGNIKIEMKKILDHYSLINLEVEEINAIINEYIYNEEYKLQLINKSKFKGRNLAEKIEKFIFVCPSCKGIDTIVSSKEYVYCNNCSSIVKIDEYGFFDKKFIFENPYQWDKWQTSYLKELISKDDNNSIIIKNTNVIISISHKNEKYKVIGMGKIILYKNRMIINIENEKIAIYIKSIKGLNIQSNNKIELMDGDYQYSIKANKAIISFYKWQLAINILKGES